MAQYVAFSPDVEIVGRGVLAMVAALHDEVRPIMREHGFPDVIDPDAWYPQQRLLDVYRDIAQAKYNRVVNLVAIGMKVPEIVTFPPDIHTIPAALQSIGAAYQMSHRGSISGDEYAFHQKGERHVRMVCRNPYPSDLDYGLIWGVVRKFRTGTTSFTVALDAAQPTRKQGADSCTYDVTWE